MVCDMSLPLGFPQVSWRRKRGRTALNLPYQPFLLAIPQLNAALSLSLKIILDRGLEDKQQILSAMMLAYTLVPSSLGSHAMLRKILWAMALNSDAMLRL